MYRLLVFLSCLLMLGHAKAESHLTKFEVESTLNLIEHHLMTAYAPREWKRTQYGRSVAEEIEHARAEVASLETITIKKAQNIVQRMMHRLRDYHAQVYFFSTEEATLPFTVKGVDGRYFVTSIHAPKWSTALYQICCGDELLFFDGKRVDDAINEIKEALSLCAREATDQSICEIFLTQRKAALISSEIPRGSIELIFRSRSTGKPFAIELAWDYQPEKIDCNCFFDSSLFSHKTKSPLHDQQLLQKEMLFSSFPYLHTHMQNMKASPSNLGAKESFLPRLGKILWQTARNNPFQAYIFRGPKDLKIGFLRIPTYAVENPKESLEALQAVITIFEEQTEMLIIDQLNNPGGAAFYLYAIASMLTDKPLHTPYHQTAITQLDVVHALQNLEAISEIHSNNEAIRIFGDSICGYPVDYQFVQNIKNYERFILNQWHKGNVLTEPFHIWGVDSINPHRFARYTKPFLILINDLDFSAADFFPILFENKEKVWTFGSQTAGAGGAVEQFSFFNRLGIANISFPKTLAITENNLPIEDLGIAPDFPYHVQIEDIKNGYRSYKTALLECVAQLADSFTDDD